MSLELLPEELWLDVFAKGGLLEPAYQFVLRNVNRTLSRVFQDLWLSRNPLVTFCMHGHISLVKWDQEGPAKSLLTTEAVAYAATNSLELVKYLLDLGCPLDAGAFTLASLYGPAEVVRHLKTIGAPLDSSAHFSLARRGDVDLFRFVLGDRAFGEDQALFGAYRGGSRSMIYHTRMRADLDEFCGELLLQVSELGNLQLFTQLFELLVRFRLLSWKKAFSIVVGHGHMDIIEKLREEFPMERQEDLIGSALLGGHLEAFKWVLSHVTDSNVLNSENLKLAWSVAAQNCGVQFFRLGIKHGLKLTPLLLEAALSSRNDKVIDFLLEAECPIDQGVFVAAVATGNKALVDQLLAKGCVWTAEAAAAVAREGNLGQLKSLRRLGCPIDETALHAAVGGGHLRIVKYLHEELGIELDEVVLRKAIFHASLPVLRYIHSKNQVKITNICLEKPFAFIQIPLLRQLRDMGLTLSSRIAIEAGEVANLNLVYWLFKECKFDFAEQEIIYRAIHKKLHSSERILTTLQWIREQMKLNKPPYVDDVDRYLRLNLLDIPIFGYEAEYVGTGVSDSDDDNDDDDFSDDGSLSGDGSGDHDWLDKWREGDSTEEYS